MGRIFEPPSTTKDNTSFMKGYVASELNETYRILKIGYEVNDGKFINFIDDTEER